MTATWKIWNTFSPCNFQNRNDFPALSYTIIAQLKWKIISPAWIFPEQFITRTVLFLKNRSAKSPLLCLFVSMIKEVRTPSERPLPTSLSKFTQGNRFWNWFWKTMGEVDLNFKWAISLRKEISSIKIPSLNWFSQAPPTSSMLNLSRESKVALRFSSVRSRVTAIFKSNLTTWGNYFGMSSTVCCWIIYSGKPCHLIICKGHHTPEKIFLRWIDKVIVGWKAIHHHRADQNPHQRWSDLQRKPAVHHPSDWGCDPFFITSVRGCGIRRNSYNTFCRNGFLARI